jgi:alkylation response protein AidB-like acyl-CoA dehydrogenase
MIELQPTAEQEEPAAAAASFLSEELPTTRLRPVGDSVLNKDAEKWPQLGSLGFFGISLPEELGGVGYSIIEEVLVFREFGRYLVSPQALGTALGAQVAAYTKQVELAAAMMAGSSPVGIAASIDGDDAEGLGKRPCYLIEAHNAEWVIWWNDSGAALMRTAAFTDIQPVPSTDSTITLASAVPGRDAPEIWLPADKLPIQRRALLLTAATLVGMAEASRDDSVAYAKVREQFGQAIGSFQAVKHRCADMATRASAARAQTLLGALTYAEHTGDAAFQVIAAKIVSSDAAIRNAAANIQNHGGIGFTAEVEAHHFLKRSHLFDQLGADQRALRNRLLAEKAPL